MKFDRIVNATLFKYNFANKAQVPLTEDLFTGIVIEATEEEIEAWYSRWDANKDLKCDPTVMQELDIARYQLWKKRPFFGEILQRMRVQCDTDTETMAVNKRGDLFIGPGFFKTLSNAERAGVLLHEIMHITEYSFFRLKGRDFELWNCATDLTINWSIVQFGDNEIKLPPIGLISGPDGIFKPYKRNVKFKKDTQIPCIDPKTSQPYSAEEIYDFLKSSFDDDYLLLLKQMREKLDEHLKPGQKPQGPPPPKPPKGPTKKPWLPEPGEPVYNAVNREYGVCISADEKTGVVKIKPITKQEAVDMSVIGGPSGPIVY